MRYTNRQYARALVEALSEEKTETGRKKATRNFLDILKWHHRSGQLRFILNEAEREYYALHGLRLLEIYSATPLPKHTIGEIKTVIGAKAEVHEHTDPFVLAGARIIIDGETLIDASARRQIERLLSFRKRMASQQLSQPHMPNMM